MFLNLLQLWSLLLTPSLHPLQPAHHNALQTYKSSNHEGIVWDTILQKLDHFNVSDQRTFELHYATLSDFFVPDGPIFLTITDVVALPWELASSQMKDIGEEAGAHLVAVEQRFSAFSFPSYNLTMDMLQYNSIEQKLQDLISLITSLKSQQIFAKSKVVIFGCSLTANLATWLRLKHPDVIFAAVSSSAPVDVKADFIEEQETFSEMLREEGGEECRDIVFKGFQEIMDLAAVNNSKRFQEVFKICSLPSLKPEDLSTFLLNIIALIQFVPWVGGCEVLKSAPGNPLDKVGAYIITSFYPEDDCIPPQTLQDAVDELHPETGAVYVRQLFYSFCSQYGLFTTSKNYTQHLFADSVPIEFYTNQLCPRIFDASLFGNNVISKIEATNRNYGGKTPNVTQVISVHGARCPLRKVGITEDLNPESPAIVIEGEFTCTDIYGSSQDDSPQLKDAKQKIKETVLKWLN